MKKTLLSWILVLGLCLSLACPAMAAAPALLIDDADLLTPAEEAELEAYLQEILALYQVEVSILTVNSTEGMSPDDFINYVYDSYDYGYGPGRDGVLLMVDMGDRNYRILSNGLAADAISLSLIDSIGGSVAPYLSDGEYASAFWEYIDSCEYYINGHINGYPFDFFPTLLAALAIGFVIALIVTGIMKGQLKSVRQKYAAGDYIRKNSMRITLANELFLYREVSRQEKPKNNDSSRSSGSSSGGRNVGGGSF